jgi:hypothetical protein
MPRLRDDFDGIEVWMYPNDDRKHRAPHFHVHYAEHEAVIRLPDLEVIAGAVPPKKLKPALEWAEAHLPQLQSCWKLAVRGESIPRITDTDASST